MDSTDDSRGLSGQYRNDQSTLNAHGNSPTTPNRYIIPQHRREQNPRITSGRASTNLSPYPSTDCTPGKRASEQHAQETERKDSAVTTSDKDADEEEKAKEEDWVGPTGDGEERRTTGTMDDDEEATTADEVEGLRAELDKARAEVNELEGLRAAADANAKKATEEAHIIRAQLSQAKLENQESRQELGKTRLQIKELEEMEEKAKNSFLVEVNKATAELDKMKLELRGTKAMLEDANEKVEKAKSEAKLAEVKKQELQDL